MIQERCDKPERQPKRERNADIAQARNAEAKSCKTSPGRSEQEYEKYRDQECDRDDESDGQLDARSNNRCGDECRDVDHDKKANAQTQCFHFQEHRVAPRRHTNLSNEMELSHRWRRRALISLHPS